MPLAAATGRGVGQLRQAVADQGAVGGSRLDDQTADWLRWCMALESDPGSGMDAGFAPS